MYVGDVAGNNRFCPCVVGASKEALEEELGWQLAQKEEWSQRLKEAEVGPSTSQTLNMRSNPPHAKPSLIVLNDST